MRTYRITCYQHGHYREPNTPEFATAPHARIGVVASVIFRKVYGRAPSRFWRKDGFMAEARDRRGNHVVVEQINDDQLPGFDLRTKRFPLVLVTPPAP